MNKLVDDWEGLSVIFFFYGIVSYDKIDNKKGILY